jgi:hypothetical protein
VPKGPSDRPVSPADAEAGALQAALRQAQERGAAPVAPGHAAEPDTPDHVSVVEPSQALDEATIRGQNRGAHSFVLAKEEKKPQEVPAGEPSPDPRGKGTTLDTQG